MQTGHAKSRKVFRLALRKRYDGAGQTPCLRVTDKTMTVVVPSMTVVVGPARAGRLGIFPLRFSTEVSRLRRCLEDVRFEVVAGLEAK